MEKPILLATNTYGMLNGEVNGVAYTCRNLVDHFRAARIPVDVVTYGSRDTVYCPDDRTRIITHDPRNGLAIDPSLRVDPFFAMGHAAREVAATRYSLVHSTTPDPLGWFAAAVARKQDVPFVAGYHTLLDVYARIRFGLVVGRAMRVLLDWYYGMADLIFAPSEAIRDMLASRYTAPMAVVGRGVDHNVFSPHHRTRSRDGEVRALYLGRVANEKGLDKLIDLLGSGVSLTVAGDGPDLRALRRRLPGARFTGMITGGDLSRELANADFFVFPSETDSFGNVVLQAMSSGLPVVAMDKLGPTASVIDGVTGFLARDRNEFAFACRRLSIDAPLRRRMGEAARAHALTFRWEDVFGGMLEQYARAGWNAALPMAA